MNLVDICIYRDGRVKQASVRCDKVIGDGAKVRLVKVKVIGSGVLIIYKMIRFNSEVRASSDISGKVSPGSGMGGAFFLLNRGLLGRGSVDPSTHITVTRL